jgi:hypothetical protein
MEVKQTESCIAIGGGVFFDLLRPHEMTFDIEVIANALSNICRYTGHVDRYYSVAEHCVLVSRIVPPRYALEGLLHDASEAYVGDVSSPLKRLLPDYRKIEDNVQDALAKAFGLVYPYPKEIHDADKRLYWAERATVAPGPDKLWHQDLRATRKVTPSGMSPTMARRMFLQRYKELTNGRQGYEPLRGQGAPQAKAA